MRISKCNIEQSSDPLENDERETRVKKLERVLESCLQRVMQLERSVQVRRVDVMDTMSHHFHETVTLFLRREILLQLQRPFRRAGINSGIVDGGHTSGHVSAHVDCTLTEFAAIARDVSSNKYYGAGFLPSFTATQSISSATNEAYITFPSLQKLCCWRCIKEFGDREAMLIREGKVGTGCEAITRVLGHMSLEQTSDGRNQVNYYVGTSSLSSEITEPPPYSNILFRRSSQWDPQNDSFCHGIELRSGCPPRQNTESVEECIELVKSTAFHLSWKRRLSLSQRMWTKDVTSDREHDLGELHVVMPTLFFFFPAVCREVDSVLTIDFFKLLLQ